MTSDEAITKVREYLQGSATTLQIATVCDGQPWVASVYFVVDDDLNVYWLSWPERRHSQDIAVNPRVAAVVAVKQDQPVIGVQFAGNAEIVTDIDSVHKVAPLYVAKYGQGEKFVEHYEAGTNRHQLYRLTPSEVQLFDELNYPSAGPLTVALSL